MKNNKKGFTIVELIIVIAIIGILAAVLIPTFSNVIYKAAVSKDIQLVRNLNTSLATEIDEKTTMHEAIECSKNSGLTVDRIAETTADNEILWDSKNHVYCYYNHKTNEIEYYPNQSFKYTRDNTNPEYTLSDDDYFIISNTISDKYSTYLYNYDSTVSEIEISKGLDLGNETGISKITFTGNNDAIIRTNSLQSVLVINDSSKQASVFHYGSAGFVNIESIADSSYHEYGTVARLKAMDGHVVIEAQANVICMMDLSESATFEIKSENVNDLKNELVPDCGYGHHVYSELTEENSEYKICEKCGYLLVKAGYDTDSNPVYHTSYSATDLVDDNNYEIPEIKELPHVTKYSLSDFANMRISFVGDSITAGVGASPMDGNRYVDVIKSVLGCDTYNGGYSGSTLCSGGDRPTNIDKLSKTYLGDSDVVFILMGINDWDQACKEGFVGGNLNPQNITYGSKTYYDLGDLTSTDNSTIYGALKEWNDKIQALKATDKYKDTQFIWMTPIITSYNDSVTSTRDFNQNKTNVHGFKLRDLCQAIIEVAYSYELPVIDLNQISGIYYNSEVDKTTNLYFGDGIHPNNAGHAQIAKTIISQIVSDYSQIESISLQLESNSIEAEQSTTCTALLNLENPNYNELKWSVSDDTVAGIEINGNTVTISALKAGTVNIICKSVLDSSIVSQVTLTVTPKPVPITGITLSGNNTVYQGSDVVISATLAPSNTSQTAVIWTVNNNNVTLNANGLSCSVHGVSAGSSTITCTSSSNENIYATFDVTVKEPPINLANLEFSCGSDNISYNTETHKLSGSGSGSGGWNSLVKNYSAILNSHAITAGMEIEFTIQKFPEGNTPDFANGNGFAFAFGLSDCTDINKVQTSWSNLCLGNINAFISFNSSPATPNSLEYGVNNLNNKKYYTYSQSNTDPTFYDDKIITISRDSNGIVDIKIDNVSILNDTIRNTQQYIDACAQEYLYAIFNGMCTTSYGQESVFTINYIGPQR